VYLSRLYREVENIDGCVHECERILTLLGMEEDIILNRLEDLGALYIRIARRLALVHQQHRLAAICLEAASTLGCEGAETMAEIGVNMVKMKAYQEATTWMEQAVRLAPESTEVQGRVSEAMMLLEKRMVVDSMT
jgi:hypothetical protein